MKLNSINHPYFWTGLISFAMLQISATQVSARVIATGTLSGVETSIKVAGGYEVHENSGKYSLVVKSDFNVTNGPDLFFVFHPMASGTITSTNAKTNALKVEPGLKSITGAQTYDLPADFVLTKYKSLIVHCWDAAHLWGVSTLQPSVVPIAFTPGNAKRCDCIRGRLMIHPTAEFKPVQLSIYSLEGNLLLSRNFRKSDQIAPTESVDLSSFQQGFYTVLLQDSFGKSTFERIRVK